MRDIALFALVLVALLTLNGCDMATEMTSCKNMCAPRLVAKYSKDAGCVCEPLKEEPHGR